jgi:hypothetical protein
MEQIARCSTLSLLVLTTLGMINMVFYGTLMRLVQRGLTGTALDWLF